MNSPSHEYDELSEADSPDSARPVMFDHEKLDVYQFQLKFITWVTTLIEEALKTVGAKTREICDQLDRASLSSLLNTAEGNGKRQRQVRAKFFDDARGSATECAACLDALVAKKIVSGDRIIEGKRILARIVSMLCRLVERFDSGSAFREEEAAYVKGLNGDPFSYSRTRTRTKPRTRTKKKL